MAGDRNGGDDILLVVVLVDYLFGEGQGGGGHGHGGGVVNPCLLCLSNP